MSTQDLGEFIGILEDGRFIRYLETISQHAIGETLDCEGMVYLPKKGNEESGRILISDSLRFHEAQKVSRDIQNPDYQGDITSLLEEASYKATQSVHSLAGKALRERMEFDYSWGKDQGQAILMALGGEILDVEEFNSLSESETIQRRASTPSSLVFPSARKYLQLNAASRYHPKPFSINGVALNNGNKLEFMFSALRQDVPRIPHKRLIAILSAVDNQVIGKLQKTVLAPYYSLFSGYMDLDTKEFNVGIEIRGEESYEPNTSQKK